MNLNALLLHSPADLCKPGSYHLKNWLISLRDRGIVKKIGISIYSADELSLIDREFLDIVQLPLSLYDQRLLLDGTIAQLKSRGSLVYARSIFLQGLLLASSESLPSWVDRMTRDHHARLEGYAYAQKSSQLELSLDFIKCQKEVDSAVLGVCSLTEIEQIIAAWNNRLPSSVTEWHKWSIKDSSILDPRGWSK